MLTADYRLHNVEYIKFSMHIVSSEVCYSRLRVLYSFCSELIIYCWSFCEALRDPYRTTRQNPSTVVVPIIVCLFGQQKHSWAQQQVISSKRERDDFGDTEVGEEVNICATRDEQNSPLLGLVIASSSV